MTWRRYLRVQDFVWLLLFAAIAVFSPVRDPVVIGCVIAIGIVQVLEPYIHTDAYITLTLLLCYPLMYFSQQFPQAISSGYWYFLFLPVVSAASNFGLLGSAVVAIIAAAENASLLVSVWVWNLLYPDFRYGFERDEQLQLMLRILSFFLVSYVTHQLAKAKREEAPSTSGPPNNSPRRIRV